MKKILTTLALLALVISVRAQVPTIDVSSLQELYSQYSTMQQQLSTATDIKGISTQIQGLSGQILSQEQSIYNNSLGDVSKLGGQFSSYISGFSTLGNLSSDAITMSALPTSGFDNNMSFWTGNTGMSASQAESQWQTSLSKVNNNTGTALDRNIALAGYDSHVVDNARTSRVYGSNVLAQAASTVSGVKDGTLIEQAGAQNALLYQQTALLNKMKDDINDETVAEAMHRQAALKADADKASVNTAILNIPQN